MDTLLFAVFNALWQGAALIALVALALRAGLRRNATTACVVWSITFAVVALLPAIDLALARPASTPAPVARAPFLVRIAPAEPRTHVPASRADAPQPLARTYHVAYSAPPPTSDLLAPARGLVQRFDEAALRLGRVATPFVRAWSFALVAIWALVAGTLLLRLAAAYAAVARMKQAAIPLDDPLMLARLHAAGHRRRASVARSAQVEIPCAVGFRRPMILIPTRLAGSLDADDLARIVLHESAHLQRYDDWINALEQVVCALQFFQPALYVARRSIDFEREVACDDRVLEDAGEPLRYAECLARIVQRHVRGRQAAVVPGFVLRRAQVVARVRRIVDRSRDASPHLRIGAAVLGAAVMIATLGIARLQVPLVAPAAAAPELAPAPAELAPALPAAAAPQPATRRAQPAQRAPKPAQVALMPRQEASPAPTASPSPAPAPSPYARARRIHVVPDAVRIRVEPVHAAPHTETLLIDDAHGTVTRTRSTRAIEEHARAIAADVASIAPQIVHAMTPIVVRSTVQALAETEAQRVSKTPSVRFHSDGDLLDAIDEAKYPHPSVDELIALRNQGVTADYIRRMGALGRGRPSLHQLTALAVQGISPDYVGTLDRRLASAPTLDEVISLRVQGVSANWLDGLAAAGYPKLSASDAASLAVQGVSVAYVRGLLDAGLRTITPAQLVALRVQGVDGSFVRRLAQHGYRNLSIDELVRLKVSGFEP